MNLLSAEVGALSLLAGFPGGKAGLVCVIAAALLLLVAVIAVVVIIVSKRKSSVACNRVEKTAENSGNGYDPNFKVVQDIMATDSQSIIE